MANDRDAPGTAQDFLSLHPTHVVDVSVVFGEAKDPVNRERQFNPPSIPNKDIWCD